MRGARGEALLVKRQKRHHHHRVRHRTTDTTEDNRKAKLHWVDKISDKLLISDKLVFFFLITSFFDNKY